MKTSIQSFFQATQLTFKNHWSEIIKFFIAFGIILYLERSGYFDLRQLEQLLNPYIIVLGIIVLGIVLWLASLRFYLLCFKKIGIREAFKFTLIGIFFNYFVPGGVGGDVIKGVTLKKHSSLSLSQSAYITLMDRILGLFTMSFLSLLAFFFIPDHLKQSPRLKLLWIFLWGIFVLVFFLMLIFLSRRLKHILLFKWLEKIPWNFIQNIMTRFNWFKNHERYSLKIFIYSILASISSQLFSISFFMFLGFYLYSHLEIPWSVYFFVIPIGFMVTAIPISPGGVGVGQAAFLFLFNRALDHKTDFGSISVTGFQFYQLIWGFIGAYFFIFFKKKNILKAKQ